MHRHQLHRVLPGFGLVVAGFESGVSQKGDQRTEGFTGFEVRGQKLGRGVVRQICIQSLAGWALR